MVNTMSHSVLYDLAFCNEPEKEKREHRRTNGDSFGALSLQTQTGVWLVLAVADGVSSCPCDHCASQLAIKTFLEAFDAEAFSAAAFNSSTESEVATKQLTLAAELTNQAVRYAKQSGLIATFAGLLWQVGNKTAYFFRGGDARVYRVVRATAGRKAGQIVAEPLTEDQVKTVRVKMGRDTLFRSVVYGGMGSDAITVEVQPVLVEEVMGLLLCTDGFREDYRLELNGVRDAMETPSSETLCRFFKQLPESIDDLEDDATAILLRFHHM